jgi:predicted membrane protein
MRYRRLAAVSSILVLAGVAACGGAERILAPVPSQITIASGDKQRAPPRTALPDPLEVSVSTVDGAPTAGVNVHWIVTAGAGTLSATNTITDADGRASVNWTLGSNPGTQSVEAIVVAVASPALFSAIAVAPVVLHYDGAAWSPSLYDDSDMAISLTSIWGVSSSQIFAVGKCGGAALMLLYNGTAWSQPPASCAVSPFSEFSSVWGSGPSDVFVVGRSALPPSFAYWISHNDGQQWNEVYRRACSFCFVGPRAVWSRSPTDAFAVGDAGEIRHYDGTDWNLQASGTTNVLNAVWGVGTSGVFAVGDGGTILFYDGSSWQAQTSGTAQPLYAIWGTSASDVFAVGGGGAILHYDGSAWTAQNSGSPKPLRGVWGSSGSSVFAVGDGSTILFSNGAGWTAQTTSASMNLRGVWGSSPTNVFAVGQPQ